MVAVAVNADEVLKETRRNQSAAESVDIEKQITVQTQELEKVRNILADLYPDYKNGLLNKDQYLMNKQKYEEEQQRLTRSVKRLKSSLAAPGSEEHTNAFIEHFKKHGNIDRLTRPLLTELVDRITVHENGELDVTFNFRDAFEDVEPVAKARSA